MTNDLKSLATITDMVYQADLAAMQRVTAEEARVRGAIEELDDQARRAITDARAVPGMPALGADHIWRGWLMSRRRELLIELAAILARKQDAARKLTHAYGRANVAGQLSEKAEADRRRDSAVRQMTSLQERMAQTEKGGAR